MPSRLADRLPGISFEGLATATLMVAVFAVGCLMPMQNDSWWHLRVGQEIVRLGRVPLEDHLSHSAAGNPWPNHEWLAQVVFYGTYRLGGLPLLQLLGAGLMTGSWALVASLMNPRWRPLALGLVLPLSSLSWAVRPHLFTFFFLTLMLRLLTRGGARWLALLFPLWANLHSGVVIAAPVLGAAITVSLFRDRRRLPLLLGLLVAWGLGSLATPLGPRLFGFVVANLSSPVAAQLTEWQPARWGDPASTLFMLEIALLLFLVALRWRGGWHRGGPSERPWDDELLLLVALGLAVLGLRSMRHISLAAIALGPALSRLAPQRPAATASGGSQDRPRANAALLGVIVAAAAATIICLWSLPFPRLNWRPISPAAARAISACPDPMFNTYDDGGYLLWFVPGKKVFLDSRHDPYPHQLILEQFRVQASGKPGPLFERYRFRCAVIPAGDRLAQGLRARGWTTTFADQEWLVLTAPSPPGAGAD